MNYDLYNPIEDRIFFAGEYTDPVYYGSLHAAYNSGLRVLKELKETKVQGANPSGGAEKCSTVGAIPLDPSFGPFLIKHKIFNCVSEV